jgi:hypothetical protein
MRTARNASVIGVILSGVFIGSAPVLAAGVGGAGTGIGPAPNYGTASPTSENNGKATGSAEVQNIQQMLDEAGASTNAKAVTTGNIGTDGESSAAQYEAPFASNPGTMAESAKTTALSTSTYNQ